MPSLTHYGAVFKVAVRCVDAFLVTLKVFVITLDVWWERVPISLDLTFVTAHRQPVCTVAGVAYPLPWGSRRRPLLARGRDLLSLFRSRDEILW